MRVTLKKNDLKSLIFFELTNFCHHVPNSWSFSRKKINYEVENDKQILTKQRKNFWRKNSWNKWVKIVEKSEKFQTPPGVKTWQRGKNQLTCFAPLKQSLLLDSHMVVLRMNCEKIVKNFKNCPKSEKVLKKSKKFRTWYKICRFSQIFPNFCDFFEFSP